MIRRLISKSVIVQMPRLSLRHLFSCFWKSNVSIPIPGQLIPYVIKFRESRKPENIKRRRLEKLQEKKDQRIHKECKRYARIAERRIRMLLVRRDLARVYREERKVIVHAVRFDACIIPYDGTALYYHIDGITLPRGVLIEEIITDETCAAISRDIGRAVTALDTMEKCGAFLVVNMGEGVTRLPKIYHWYKKDSLTNVLDLLPQTKTSEIVIGMGENRNIFTLDIRSKHMLIGGATGWGKTNWIRQALVTLVKRNGPDQLRLVLLDFKQGAGLRIFKGIPHMWDIQSSNLSRATKEKWGEHDIGFVDDKEKVLLTMIAISEELDTRYRIFGKAEEEDIDSYNKYKHNKMPDILIVIDELADLMLDPFRRHEFRTRIEALILRVAQQGRGAGIFLWAGTQTPKADVITTLIKYNLVIKLAFNCTHASASRIILDHGGAVGLECLGRLIYQEPGNAGIELQAPLLEHEDAKRILKEIKVGEVVKDEPVPEQDIFKYAIDNLHGSLSRTSIWHEFEIGRAKLNEWLISLEYDPNEKGPLFVVNGQGYIVIPGRGNRPRYMYPVADETQMPDQNEFSEIVKKLTRSTMKNVDNKQMTAQDEEE